MIYYTEPQTENDVYFQDMGKRSWRWMIIIRPLTVTVEQQWKTEKCPTWLSTRTYFQISLHPFRWSFLKDHFFYDQDFYTCRFGPLWIEWSV